MSNDGNMRFLVAIVKLCGRLIYMENNTKPLTTKQLRLERAAAVHTTVHEIIDWGRSSDALGWIAERGEYYSQLAESLRFALTDCQENSDWAHTHGVLAVRSLLLAAIKDGDSPVSH